MGYVYCELQVGIKKATILASNQLEAKPGTRSKIGREWLTTLRYKLEPATKGESDVNSIEKDKKLCEETKKIVNEIKTLFGRNEKVKNNQVKTDLKENAKIFQQKGSQSPIRLQNAVDSDIKRVFKCGHIEEVNEMKDDEFIQSIVITVKKGQWVKIALDLRALNQAIDKDEYQRPNLEKLLEMVAEKLGIENGEA